MSTPRQRSHNGCWTCKAKRRKCDRARPTCHNCSQRGVPCEGYEVRLRWGAGIASRGRYTGAEEPVDTSVPFREKGRRRDRLRERKRQLSETESGVSPMSPITVGERIEVGDGEYSDVAFSPSQSWLIGAPEEDVKLFYQFLSSGIHILHSTTINDDANLLEPRLPSLCQKSKALFAICVAFQASISPDMKPLCVEYFDGALNQFRAELSRSVTALEDETLLAGLLLCSIGFIRGLPWTMHLYGMYQILKTQGLNIFAAQQTPFRRHLLEVLGVMDLPTFSVGRQNPSLGFWRKYCRSRDADQQTPKDSDVEVVSGIPRSLIDIFSFIGEGATEEDFWNWPGSKGTMLQHQMWEAYRLAGILAVRHCQLHPESSEDKWIGSTPHSRSHPGITIPDSSILVSRILSCLDAICRACAEPEGKDCLILNAVHYPVFVAGLQADIVNTEPGLKHVIRRCFCLRPNLLDIGGDGQLLLGFLEEYWRDPEGTNLHELARSRGVELGLL